MPEKGDPGHHEKQVDETDPYQGKNHAISREDAEMTYVACCLCGSILEPGRVYVCEECSDDR